MAIAHDAVSEAPNTTDSSTFTADTSWTHTPVGTPAGVVVIIAQSDSPDQVASVIYGGVSMQRVISVARTATEALRGYIYFLGSSIPTGAQIIEVKLTTQTAIAKHAFALTMTAAANKITKVDSSNGADLGIVANGQLTVTHTGTLSGWAGYSLVNHGGTGVITTGGVSGQTYVAGYDPGTPPVAMCWRNHGSADASSSTYGYTTSGSDDHLINAIVVNEADPASLPQPRRPGMGVLLQL